MVGLAKAHLLSDERQKATDTLEKAIRLQPANKQAKELLTTIKKRSSKG
ncbi:hypothetical protein O71_02167 [Pontibacter sp. BAB1700]|nr:hypothetical protein O71_02167 [Pontibacter sp. BAB1700]